MRAKEYIAAHEEDIDNMDLDNDVKRVINDLYPVRNNGFAMRDYFSNILTADIRYKYCRNTVEGIKYKFLNENITENYYYKRYRNTVNSQVYRFTYNEGEIKRSIARLVRSQIQDIIESDYSFHWVHYFFWVIDTFCNVFLRQYLLMIGILRIMSVQDVS